MESRGLSSQGHEGGSAVETLLMEPRILVVDDDPQITRLFQRILERGGYAVTTTASGEKALEAIRREAIQLVVLDLSMPETDGFEVLKVLRSGGPGPKVLVISGFLQGALLHAAELVGAAATLSKTEAPGRLLETVNRLLQW
jgi:CheY-like chemotaxis protein